MADTGMKEVGEMSPKHGAGRRFPEGKSRRSGSQRWRQLEYKGQSSRDEGSCAGEELQKSEKGFPGVSTER